MLNRIKTDKKKVFSPLLPPPNITGKLHLGHFFDQMISNIYLSYNKKQKKEVFFSPYIDYGGISAEILIKKIYGEVNKKNINLFELEYKQQIVDDLNSSYCSFNKKHILYTLDKEYKKLVNEVFFSLYKDKLLKRFSHVVNWCKNCSTVISDEEILHKNVEQKMFYIKYFYDSVNYVIVATTKPETIFFDRLLITNKKTEIKEVEIPVIKRKIPVVYSPKNVSEEKGTEYVKITPSIDKNDFYIYQSIYNKNPNLDCDIPQNFDQLDENNLTILHDFFNFLSPYILETKKIISSVPCCYRCNERIENKIQKQWFLDIKKMLENVNFKDINLFPESIVEEINYIKEKSTFWCISRQLKFGHKIPFYCDICDIFIDNNNISTKHCNHIEIMQEEVFDTWFSSSLCAIYHIRMTGIENNFLSCGRDILFFWVLKMLIMNNYYFKKNIFSTIFLHSIIRDEKNNKLSKSKGNYVPLNKLISKYTETGLIYMILNSFKKNKDIKLNISDIDFNNFKIKISNALIMYDNLKKLPLTKLEIDDKLEKHFELIFYQFCQFLSEFELKKAFILIKEFLFTQIFNIYFEILKKNSIFSSYASYMLNRIFNLLSIFFPNIENIYPDFKENEIKLDKKNISLEFIKNKNSYINICFFIKEVRSLKNIYKDLSCISKVDFNIDYIFNFLSLNNKINEEFHFIGESVIYKNCFFYSKKENIKFNQNRNNLDIKISKIEKDLVKMEKFSDNDLDFFCVKKNKEIDLNILKILFDEKK